MKLKLFGIIVSGMSQAISRNPKSQNLSRLQYSFARNDKKRFNNRRNIFCEQIKISRTAKNNKKLKFINNYDPLLIVDYQLPITKILVKIIKRTPNQLILQHRPIGIWLMGSILTIVGLVTIILFTRASSLTCQRVSPSQGSCELTRSHFLMSKTIIVSINDLKGSEVVMTHARQMDDFFILKPYYRVILIIPTKRIPLTVYGTTTRDQQEAIATKINSFLKNQTKPSLFIERDQRWLIYLVGGIFIVVGLLAELSKIITVTFDKILGTLTIAREGFLKTEVFEFPMEDIIGVKLKSASLFNSEKMGSHYQVALELKANKELPLTKKSTFKAPKEEIIKEITNFLCHPHFISSQESE